MEYRFCAVYFCDGIFSYRLFFDLYCWPCFLNNFQWDIFDQLFFIYVGYSLLLSVLVWFFMMAILKTDSNCAIVLHSQMRIRQFNARWEEKSVETNGIFTRFHSTRLFQHLIIIIIEMWSKSKRDCTFIFRVSTPFRWQQSQLWTISAKLR